MSQGVYNGRSYDDGPWCLKELTRLGWVHVCVMRQHVADIKHCFMMDHPADGSDGRDAFVNIEVKPLGSR